MRIHIFWKLTLVFLILSSPLPSLGLGNGDTLEDQRQTENDKYSVALLREESPPGSSWMNQYVFRLVEKGKESVHELILKDHRPPLNETHVNLSLLENRLMIRTQSQRRPISPTHFNLISLPDGRPLDDFVCYCPVISPSSRYIVYERYSPPHGLPGDEVDVVLVYDLARSAMENRLPVVAMTNDPEIMVGFPIFPPICAREERYRTLPGDDPKELGGPTSPMLWRGDDEIVFLSGQYDGSHIIRVDLKEGPLHPVSHQGPVLSATECVKPGYKLEKRRLDPFAFIASELVWDGTNAVIVKPSAYHDLKPEIRACVP